MKLQVYRVSLIVALVIVAIVGFIVLLDRGVLVLGGSNRNFPLRKLTNMERLSIMENAISKGASHYYEDADNANLHLVIPVPKVNDVHKLSSYFDYLDDLLMDFVFYKGLPDSLRLVVYEFILADGKPYIVKRNFHQYQWREFQREKKNGEKYDLATKLDGFANSSAFINENCAIAHYKDSIWFRFKNIPPTPQATDSMYAVFKAIHPLLDQYLVRGLPEDRHTVRFEVRDSLQNLLMVNNMDCTPQADKDWTSSLQ